MSNPAPLSDWEDRRAAETTFDRNIVVVAGAGTGKTTLLVNRLVHLLMRDPEPVSITQIVALTYTNKAATEMKIRLRERLTALARPSAFPAQASDGGAVSLEELRTRYGISTDAIATRAGAALTDLERAQIGTVHSFAGHVLRLYPLEAGVDPAFREDDGLRFDECFQMAWDVWVDQELGRDGAQHWRWRTLLESTTLQQLRELTYALCNDVIDVDTLVAQVGSEPNPALLEWLGGLLHEAQRLLDAHDRPKRRKIEHMLAAAIALLTLMQEKGPDSVDQLDPSEKEWLEKNAGHTISDWDERDFVHAARIIRIAKQILAFNAAYFINVVTLVRPLLTSIKTSFAETGWISFDGLLALARRLLLHQTDVRERIKRDYRAILIDEFQDTDPIQYEILLALAEQPGGYSQSWQNMTLEPGKLFIVGDPKQSIYAFRRADMEAFDRVVDKVLKEGGTMYSLTTNFRSAPSVLAPVNEVFDRLFLRQPLVQPANVRLEGDGRRPASGGETGVYLQVTTPRPGDDPFDAAEAARAEAEVLARWLREDLLSRPGVRAGDVAFLFRTLTLADAYLDALRRYNVPYLIEGEKHFYRRQEVIDLVNVLRVLDHPHDHIALLGVMRSALGGLTDREVYDLHEAGLFNYLHDTAMGTWSHPRAEGVRRLYRRLAALHDTIAAVPLDRAVQLVFDHLPILELAAASLHGEQAVANLLKLKQTAAELSDRPQLTLGRFIDLMVTRLDELPDETECPLAEDSSDAVQILTIHKAKGLEFPIVVLPGLHQGSGREKAAPAVVYDWSSNTYGLSAGAHQTLGYVRVQEKQADRERAERRRVLYVGMTRAKDLLLLSGGVTARSVGETVLQWLGDIGGGEIGSPETQTITIGSSAIVHRVVQAPERQWPRRSPTAHDRGPSVDAAAIARLWQERTVRWHALRGLAWHLTPTSVKQSQPLGGTDAPGRPGARELSRLVGIVAHRLLEEWDFSAPPSELLARIPPTVHAFMSPEHDAELQLNLADSLTEIFTQFGASEAYARLQSSAILGREIPFLIPWRDGQAIEGVIDLIYRLDGQTWIADYKTDRASVAEAPATAALYAHQAAIYREAATRCLGLSEACFQLVFLRSGLCMNL